MTVFIDQGTGLGQPAFVVRDAHFSLGHAAGGEVQHKRVARVLAPTQRYAYATRVGAEARVAAAERRHQRARPDADKVQTDETAFHRHLGVMTDAAQVMGIG